MNKRFNSVYEFIWAGKISFQYRSLFNRYFLGHNFTADAKLSPDAPLMQDSLVWQILKTVLFSFTAILHAVTSDQTGYPVGKKILPLLDVLATAGMYHAFQSAHISFLRELTMRFSLDQDVLAIYANLHFITARIGLFTAYKDTVAAAVTHLRGRPDELNKWISQTFRECGMRLSHTYFT